MKHTHEPETVAKKPMNHDNENNRNKNSDKNLNNDKKTVNEQEQNKVINKDVGKKDYKSEKEMNRMHKNSERPTNEAPYNDEDTDDSKETKRKIPNMNQ